MERLKKVYLGMPKAKLLLCFFCLCFYTVAVCWAGGSVLEIIKVTAAVLLYILLPGRFALRISGLRKDVPQLAFPLTVLLGTGMLVVIYCVTMRLGILMVLHLLPLLLSLAECALAAKEHPAGENVISLGKGLYRSVAKPHRLLLMLLASTLIFLCAFSNVLQYARPSQAGNVLIQQDFLWMVGNAKSFQLAFPSIEIRFYNVRFAYHYLTEMLCGILGLITGADCYNILAFYLQPFFLAALVLCLYVLGTVFFHGARSKAMLFAFSPFLFSCASLWAVVPNGQSLVGNSNITHLLTNITSQTTATLYLSIFCAIFLSLAGKGFRASPLSLATLVCSFVMLTVAKGPVALLAGLAALVTVVFMLFQRKAGLRAVLTTGICAAAFMLFYQMLFSASTNGSMSLSLTGTVERFILYNIASPVGYAGGIAYLVIPLLWLVQLALMIPAMILPYLSAIFEDLKHLFSLSPEHLLAQAGAAGGLLAYFLFNHPNYSQVYFFLTALFFIGLLAIDRFDAIRNGVQSSKRRCRAWSCVALGGVCIAFVTAGLLYVHIGGSGIRAFLRDVGIEQKYPYTTTICADDEAAGEWLAKNTDGAATMFATNRIHSDRIHSDGISNVYTAFSGRQAFMEGYAYVADSAPWMWVQERQQVNAALFSAATDETTLRALCAEYGITHLIYSTQMDGDESQLKDALPCVFHSDTVRIYSLE